MAIGSPQPPQPTHVRGITTIPLPDDNHPRPTSTTVSPIPKGESTTVKEPATKGKVSKKQHSKVVIIGSGPGGQTAAIFVARANLEPVLYEEMLANGFAPSGQLTTTTEVETFPGFPEGVTGTEMMDKFRAQSERFGTKIIAETIARVDLSTRPFRYWAEGEEDDTEFMTAETIIIATGAPAKRLFLPGEDTWWQSGIFAAAEEAIYLAKYGSRVYVLVGQDELRASKIMAKRLVSHPKVTVLWNTVATECKGDGDLLQSLAIKDIKTGEEKELAINGLFYAFGHDPATALVKSQVELDADGYQGGARAITSPGRSSSRSRPSDLELWPSIANMFPTFPPPHILHPVPKIIVLSVRMILHCASDKLALADLSRMVAIAEEHDEVAFAVRPALIMALEALKGRWRGRGLVNEVGRMLRMIAGKFARWPSSWLTTTLAMQTGRTWGDWRRTHSFAPGSSAEALSQHMTCLAVQQVLQAPGCPTVLVHVWTEEDMRGMSGLQSRFPNLQIAFCQTAYGFVDHVQVFSTSITQPPRPPMSESTHLATSPPLHPHAPLPNPSDPTSSTADGGIPRTAIPSFTPTAPATPPDLPLPANHLSSLFFAYFDTNMAVKSGPLGGSNTVFSEAGMEEVWSVLLEERGSSGKCAAPHGVVLELGEKVSGLCEWARQVPGRWEGSFILSSVYPYGQVPTGRFWSDDLVLPRRGPIEKDNLILYEVLKAEARGCRGRFSTKGVLCNLTYEVLEGSP
ncbi:hypothetical protein IAT38_002842 [Cryptococcus sp. DSM 104549]